MTNGNSRSNEIATTLRTEILRSQYRVGERLPSERDLSSRFTANRGAVREALKQLEQLGIISIQPGGARVLPKEEATLEILGHLLCLNEYPDARLVDQFLEVFKALCVMSAESFLSHANESQLLYVKSIVRDMKRDVGDREAFRAHWSEFLEYLLTTDNNLVVRLITNGLKGQLMERMTNFQIKPQTNREEMSSIVDKLILSLNSKDSKMLGLAIAQHFDLIRNMAATALNYLQPMQENYS